MDSGSHCPRFDVQFHPGAAREYEDLDPQVKGIVDKQFEQLSERADEVGKRLSNTNKTALHGCKEIKLRDLGIRIIYRITNNTIDVLRIVYVLAIQKRERGIAFQVAHRRLQEAEEGEQRHRKKK